MGGYFLEEDDELRKLRERFQQGGQSQPEYGASVGGGGSLSAPPAELDPRMLQGFLSQRPADTRQPAYPIPVRESPSFLEENGLPIAAGIADIIANRGRGLGQITQSVVAGKNARMNRESEQFEADRGAYMKQQAAEEEAKARTQSFGLNSRNADLREREADLAAARERGLMERFTKGMPDPELTKREKEAEIRLREAQANDNEASAYSKWTGDDKAITPYQQAQLDAMKDERKSRDLDRDEDRADRKAGREASAGATKAQQEATAILKKQEADRQAEKDKQGRMNKFRDETEKTRPALGNLQRLETLLEKPEYAKDIPGVGMADSRTPRWMLSDDAIAVQSLRGDIGDLLGRQRSGSAIPPAEYSRLSAFSTGGENATEKEFRTIKELYKKHLLAEAQQQANGREDDAREVLGGLGDYALGPRKVPTPVLEQQPSAAPLVPEQVPPPPRGAPMPLPRDASTPGPDTLEPTQRLGATGPNYRGTQGFPGSAAPSNTYQGPLRPPSNAVLPPDVEERLRSRGVVFR